MKAIVRCSGLAATVSGLRSPVDLNFMVDSSD